MSRISLLWRSLFLIAFLVAMPILALPSVARRLDDYLYGHEESPLIAETTNPLAEEPNGDGIAQATFEVSIEPPASRTSVKQERGLDAAVAAPPPMAATPEFQQPTSSADEESLSIPTDLRIVRQRLQDLGADYILLEADESGQHRFHCRMLVSAGSEETESFEATGADAAKVAQQVLKAVEDWRSSQLAPIR